MPEGSVTMLAPCNIAVVEAHRAFTEYLKDHNL